MFSFPVYNQMLPLERYIKDSLDRKVPVMDIIKWIEVTCPDFMSVSTHLRQLVITIAVLLSVLLACAPRNFLLHSDCHPKAVPES